MLLLLLFSFSFVIDADFDAGFGGDFDGDFDGDFVMADDFCGLSTGPKLYTICFVIFSLIKILFVF